MGEIVGVFDFGRKGRGECFCGEKREKPERGVVKVDWKKNGGRAREEKKDGWGGKAGLLYTAQYS